MPWRLIAGRRCLITVYTTGLPDREKWYAIWKHAVAVARLCVSARGKPGIAYGLGERHHLGNSTDILQADKSLLGLEDRKIYIELTDSR